MSRVTDVPATIKILLIAIVLILLPGAVLSYVSYMSVNERARRLDAGYRGTLYMVRDRIEAEVLRLEQGLRSSLDAAGARPRSLSASRELLRQVAADSPWLRRPFLAGPDGDLVTPSMSFGWPTRPSGSFSWAPPLQELLARAETAEFLRKDAAGALQLYARALERARSAGERAELLSRVGRCRLKLGNHEGGIQDYRKLLELSETAASVGEIPTFIVALSQIADGYAAAKDERARIGALLQLHQRLVDSPWDVAAAECEYYLKQTGSELEAYLARSDSDRSVLGREKMNALKELETTRLEEMKHAGWIERALLPEMRAGRNRSLVDPSIGHVSTNRDGRVVSVGYLRMQSAAPAPGQWLLGYELNEDQVTGSLLPRVLKGVDLGGDIRVGILDEGGKVRFPPTNAVPPAFLAAGHFAEILPSWQVGVFHPDGRSIDDLVWREKATSLAFLGGTLLVIILGISLTVRAAAHEVALSRLKSDFVSNVSHEFKTPLALIRMFGETLETGMVEDEAKRREFYRIIRTESERLTHLINKVLDVSRIDAGVKQYAFREADVVDVIRRTVDTYRLQVRDLGFTIDVELPPQPVMGRIDPDAVSEALLNLLDNATKYSGESRHIAVSVRAAESSTAVSVEDHGVGIPKDDLPNIFDKFYRARTQQTRETPGSGLGLALVRHIVEAHGGRVEVASELGRGSRFSFVVPLRG
jgi:signal transduction histidine kinase